MALNPFRSEAEAYRFVWLTIGYFGLIVAGAVINRWLGLAVFIVLSALVLFFYFRGGERRTRVLAPTRAHTPEDERRILVIANETVGGETCARRFASEAKGRRAQVLVVDAGAEHPAQALGLGRRPGARRCAGAPSSAAWRVWNGCGHRSPRRDRRRRAAAGDRGRPPHFRRRRDHHLDPPRRPVELAGEGRRQQRPRALRGPDHARRRRPGTREAKRFS